MFEHTSQPLLPRRDFLLRLLRNVGLGAGLVACGLLLGTLGYHVLESLDWDDAFLNASMILGGMGPVDRMDSSAGKLFSALYALFSGLVFVGLMGIVLAPWVHRLLHWTHLEDQSER